MHFVLHRKTSICYRVLHFLRINAHVKHNKTEISFFTNSSPKLNVLQLDHMSTLPNIEAKSSNCHPNLSYISLSRGLGKRFMTVVNLKGHEKGGVFSFLEAGGGVQALG